VDLFKIGKWNHAAEARAIDWKAFYVEVTELLEDLGCKYMIKKDLKTAVDAIGHKMHKSHKG
jgi:hypothetical protein